MSVLMFAETEMESLTSLTTVLIYQMVNREMPMEIRKVRCDSVATGSEKSILSSLIKACPIRELQGEDNW